jgi:hypothetical protein
MPRRRLFVALACAGCLEPLQGRQGDPARLAELHRLQLASLDKAIDRHSGHLETFGNVFDRQILFVHRLYLLVVILHHLYALYVLEQMKVARLLDNWRAV